MLEGCLSNPDKRIWYAIWNMELKNDPGTIAVIFALRDLVMMEWLKKDMV